MQEINLDQFEMTNESMSKVLGGVNIVSTPGHYYPDADVWCGSDSGDSDSNTIVAGYDCEALSSDDD